MADLYNWQFSKMDHYVWRDSQDAETYHFGITTPDNWDWSCWFTLPLDAVGDLFGLDFQTWLDHRTRGEFPFRIQLAARVPNKSEVKDAKD